MSRLLCRGVVLGVCVLLTSLQTGCHRPLEGFRAASDVSYTATPWTFDESAGLKIRTPHYEIFTTVEDPGLTDALPQMMETAFAYYRHLLPTPREPNTPMQVYLFASRADWANFTQRFGSGRAGTLLQVRYGGYSEQGVTVIEYTSHQGAFPLMTHEGFHQFVYFCVPEPIPAWLNEGLAVICEGQRWSNGGLIRFDPKHNPRRQNDLAEAIFRKELLPLRELLRINAGHVVGGNPRGIANYYAQVWALMLFLQNGEGGKYAGGFERMLHKLAAGEAEQSIAAARVVSKGPAPAGPGEALFRAFISDDLDLVESEFKRYLDTNILGETAAIEPPSARRG